MAGPAIAEVIAIHRGDHDMLEAQPRRGLPQPVRFGGIEAANALVEVDVAVGAGPGAAGAHDQKSRRAAREALADVGAAGFLANGVELEIQQQIGDFADAFPLGSFNAQPVGFQQGIVSAPKAPESPSTLGSDWAAISYTPAIGM